MNRYELVIAGGGLAAARAIKSYREAGGGGRIALVSQEAVLPYHRPSLSKKYLRGERNETPLVEDEGFYLDHDVDVMLGVAVVAVDTWRRAVTLGDGTHLRFEQLLLATGVTPRRLSVPGADLDGVFSLRTIDDSNAIRDAASAAKRAVVVGAGFIGMETAASLRQLGLDVALVHMGEGLFDQLRSPELSEELASLYRTQGVDVRLGEEVERFRGDGRIETVETKSGLAQPADLAVVGVGVVPNVKFLAGSGARTDNGIVVNERFETTVPGIFAVGDVANFVDPLFGRRRIEHWSNANEQGAEVGRILAGADGGYEGVSSFFSEVFGVTIKVFGDVSRFDVQTAEGSFADGFLATYGDGGRLVGAVTVGQSDTCETFVKELIADRAPIDALEEQLVA